MVLRQKSIKFDLDDPEERKLWDWLRTLGHGEFSNQTKAYWMEKMKEKEEQK